METDIQCSNLNDCLNDCARNPICSDDDLCNYSSYKTEGRFCLTEDYELSNCNGIGGCNNINIGEQSNVDDDTEEFASEPTEPDPEVCESDERHRKPWHMITDEERILYINGFKQLYEQGKIASFTSSHSSDETVNQAHATSTFLPWHRYYIWELETQIRNLGGEFKCFSLPWWDSTHETQIEGGYHILSSGLGGSGEEENEYCVMDGPFAAGEYIPSSCAESSCCLQRDARSWTESIFLTPQETLKYITDYPIYGDDNINIDDRIDGFCRNVEGKPHGSLHVIIGGIGQLGNVKASPDDPIFYLLHASVDYLWALWQDCYNYDEIDSEDIDDNIYTGLGLQETTSGTLYGPSGIDDTLNYADLTTVEWSLVSSHDLTPRDMHNIREWDVSYEKGDFYERAKVDELQELCLTINEEWFYNEPIVENKEETAAEIFADDTFTFLKYKQFQQYPTTITTEERNREILDSWSRITCEYNEFSLHNPCYRPRTFDDCGSDPKYEGIDGDIDISLDELLERVSSSECMMETRKLYYEWAKNSKRLMDLCNGEFDHFCDDHFLKEDQKDEFAVNSMNIVNQPDSDTNNDINSTNDLKSTNTSKVYMVIGGIGICLLILIIFGLLFYIKKLKQRTLPHMNSSFPEQEMVSYGSTKNKEIDSFLLS